MQLQNHDLTMLKHLLVPYAETENIFVPQRKHSTTSIVTHHHHLHRHHPLERLHLNQHHQIYHSEDPPAT